ncbi:MAG TPA: SH3 domain-containing protein [Usitatibacter sp.]|nr:SH3 domain-containing protein [Usitatibacter sp.]
MRLRPLAALLLLAALGIARAEDQGFTNRATELKEKGAADAATVATLPENTPVKVLARGGAWTQVEAGGHTGWVRVFHLRFQGAVESSSGSGLASLGSALGFGSSSNSQAKLASTGIRGLTTEDVKNANPDPEALALMQSFRADRPAAERFAKEAKLAAAHVDVPAATGKGDSR